MLLTVTTLLLLAHAQTVVTLTIALAGFGFTMNMLLSTLLANIPDRVPMAQRASVSAIFGIAQPLGTLVGIIVISQLNNIVASYYFIATILCVAVITFVLFVPERAISSEDISPFSWGSFFLGFVKPLQHRDFRFAWLARFFTIAAQTVLATYILFYIQDAHLLPVSQSAAGVGIFQLIQTIALVITSVVAGKLSDRLQRRKVFILGAGAMMFIAFVLLMLFPSWAVVLVSSAIFGAGFGIFIAGDVALSTQVLPDAKTQGRDMGIITAGTILPELLFPLIAWLAFSVLNGYASLFGICAAACVLGAVCVLPIKTVR